MMRLTEADELIECLLKEPYSLFIEIVHNATCKHVSARNLPAESVDVYETKVKTKDGMKLMLAIYWF